jgi:hypothetical protein
MQLLDAAAGLLSVPVGLSDTFLTGPVDHFRGLLDALRKGYEPYAHSLSHELLMELPPWMPPRRPEKTTGKPRRGTDQSRTERSIRDI